MEELEIEARIIKIEQYLVNTTIMMMHHIDCTRKILNNTLANTQLNTTKLSELTDIIGVKIHDWFDKDGDQDLVLRTLGSVNKVLKKVLQRPKLIPVQMKNQIKLVFTNELAKTALLVKKQIFDKIKEEVYDATK